MGHVLFRRRLNSFISCRRVWRCMLCIPFTQLKCSVPYLVTSEWCDECRFPLCQPYTVPVRISTLDDDVSVAKIHQHHDPWCEEQFCCRRPRYNLQCKFDVILFEASLYNLIFSYGPQLPVRAKQQPTNRGFLVRCWQSTFTNSAKNCLTTMKSVHSSP